MQFAKVILVAVVLSLGTFFLPSRLAFAHGEELRGMGGEYKGIGGMGGGFKGVGGMGGGFKGIGGMGGGFKGVGGMGGGMRGADLEGYERSNSRFGAYTGRSDEQFGGYTGRSDERFGTYSGKSDERFGTWGPSNEGESESRCGPDRSLVTRLVMQRMVERARSGQSVLSSLPVQNNSGYSRSSYAARQLAGEVQGTVGHMLGRTMRGGSGGYQQFQTINPYTRDPRFHIYGGE